MNRFIFVSLLFLLSACAAEEDEFAARVNHIPAWVKSIQTLPRVEGFRQAGIFDLDDTFIAQFCDSHGNQKWMKYDNETHKWSGVKHVTYGSKNGYEGD